MKEIKMYECEICNEIYISEEEANQCELRGIEIPLAKGKQLKYIQNISGFKNEINAYIAKVEERGHINIYTLKAFDWNNKKYILAEIWGKVEILRKCKSV